MNSVYEFMMMIVILSFLGVLLFILAATSSRENGGYTEGLIKAVKSMLSVNITDGIMFCLIACFIIVQMISSKIEGWYEGLYSYNNSHYNDPDVDFDYNNKDNFPLPIGFPEVNTLTDTGEKIFKFEKLIKLTSGIFYIQISLFVMIASLFIFRNWPLKTNTLRGQRDKPLWLARTFIAALGILLAVACSMSFVTVFAPISSQSSILKDSLKDSLQDRYSCDLQNGEYYLPTTEEQLLPPSKDYKYLLFWLTFYVSIAIGLSMGVLTSNMAKNSYEIMKVKSAYINDLTDEGRLVAFELQDPLFKLLDHIIAKKTEFIESSSVFDPITRTTRPRSSIENKLPLKKEPPIKLFDFVKIKKHRTSSNKKSRLIEDRSINDEDIYLVAAINGWTILPTSDGNKFLYLDQTVEMTDEEYIGDEGQKSKLKEKYKNKYSFALNDEEFVEKRNKREQVKYEENPMEAKKNIYGGATWETYPNYMDKLEVSNNQDLPLPEPSGAALPNSKLYLIPIDITDFKISDIHTKGEKYITSTIEFITDILKDQDLFNNYKLKQKLSEISDLDLRNETANLFTMIQNIITSEFEEYVRINAEDLDNMPRPILEVTESGEKQMVLFQDIGDNDDDYLTQNDDSKIIDINEELQIQLEKVGPPNIQSDVINSFHTNFEYARSGVRGRKYTNINQKADGIYKRFSTEPLPDVTVPITGGIMKLRVGVMSKVPLTIRDYRDVKVIRRIKENIDLEDLSALDLIDLRYGIVHDIALTKTKNTRGTVVQNRFTDYSVSATQGYEMDKRQLLQHLLPQIKDQADEEALNEYDLAIKTNIVGRETDDVKINNELILFENRFNSILMEQEENVPTKFNLKSIEKTSNPLVLGSNLEPL